MAKKHKKRKKLSRRARRRAPGQASAAPAAAPAATADEPAAGPVKPAKHEPELAHPAALQKSPDQPAAAQPEQAPAPAEPTPAAFDTAARQAKLGQAATMDYAAVRKDLRKLGLTIIVFALIIAGLGLLGSTTNIIGDLGQQLFRLW